MTDRYADQPEVEVSTAAVAATEAIAHLARDLHREADATELLHRVVTTIPRVLPDVEHAAITLVRGNEEFLTAAATGPLPQHVDAIQYATGQGPCLDVLRHEHTYRSRDLTTETRWPAFTGRTVAETPVRSMMSFQLLADEDTLGALNLYGTHAGSFDRGDLQALCAVFATHAALALSRALQHDQFLGMQAGVGNARDINTAIGLTMATEKLSRQAAFAQLRQRARNHRQSLADVSRDLIDAADTTVDGPGKRKQRPPGAD